VGIDPMVMNTLPLPSGRAGAVSARCWRRFGVAPDVGSLARHLVRDRVLGHGIDSG